MTFTQRMAVPMEVAFVCVGLAVHGVAAQEPSQLRRVDIPTTGVALKSIPVVRIDSAEGTTTRRVRGAADSARDRLWAKTVDSGAFTYLSAEPGKYVRVTPLGDRIAYVEHVDLALGSVTWLGELRIVAGARPAP